MHDSDNSEMSATATATVQPSPSEDLAARQGRLQLLLEFNNVICSRLEIRDLFSEFTAALRQVLNHEFSQVILYDPSVDQLRTRACYFPDGKGLIHEGLLIPIEDTPAGHVFTTGRPLRMDRPDSVRKPTDVVDRLLEEGVRSGCCVPLVCRGRTIGVLSVGSSRECAFTQADEVLLSEIAAQLAIAIENAVTHENLRNSQEELAKDHARLKLLLRINNVLVTKLDVRALFAEISSSLRQLTRHLYSQVLLYDDRTDKLIVRALDFPKGMGLIHEGLVVPLQGSVAGRTFTTRKPLLVERLDRKKFPAETTALLLAEGVRSVCLAPLICHDRTLGVISIGRGDEAPFSSEEADLLSSVSEQISIAVANALAVSRLSELNSRLGKENEYLEETVRTEGGFDEIIADSPAMKAIVKKIELAAPTDAAILITGETGTGKELVARGIHNLSHRRNQPFVKLNCAAIPGGLLESELFGHEKGAFTGAIAQRIGRMELADGGTLFLDEVGDLPLDLQPKLLRALQEKAFERLGGRRTIQADIRLVAATNRDLAQLIAEHQYRSDLYYRLAVFPIVTPPLREHPEDIPLLVNYFVQKYARRINRKINSVTPEAMKRLCEYSWPGNVRELEHFIERALIMSSGPVLDLSGVDLQTLTPAYPARVTTLREIERGHILQALEASKWVLGGPNGAALKLGLKRTTLSARMRRLGINRNN